MSGNHEICTEIVAMLRASEMREVRIATLVEASRLVCTACSGGSGWTQKPVGIVDDRWVLHFADDGLHDHSDCRAAEIIMKLAELWGESR